MGTTASVENQSYQQSGPGRDDPYQHNYGPSIWSASPGPATEERGTDAPQVIRRIHTAACYQGADRNEPRSLQDWLRNPNNDSSFNTSGSSEESFNTSGRSDGSFSRSGRSNKSFNTSGRSDESFNTSGRSDGSFSCSGTSDGSFSSAGKGDATVHNFWNRTPSSDTEEYMFGVVSPSASIDEDRGGNFCFTCGSSVSLCTCSDNSADSYDSTSSAVSGTPRPPFRFGYTSSDEDGSGSSDLESSGDHNSSSSSTNAPGPFQSSNTTTRYSSQNGWSGGAATAANNPWTGYGGYGDGGYGYQQNGSW